MQKEFTITKVSWITQRKGHIADREKVIKSHQALIFFLQKNGLANKILLYENQLIDDEFSLKSTDLTNEGILLLKKCYEKWLDSQDRGKDPSDVSILEKNLTLIRKTK